MASTVLSGASSRIIDPTSKTPLPPLYINNTTAAVRIVINYMSSIREFSSTNTSQIFQGIRLVWAGVTETAVIPGNSGAQRFCIGRNIANISISEPAYNPINQYPSGTQAFVSANNAGIIGPGQLESSNDSLASFSANMSISSTYNGRIAVTALPTELMLAPNQSFSAICGVYNIVVIPENG